MHVTGNGVLAATQDQRHSAPPRRVILVVSQGTTTMRTFWSVPLVLAVIGYSDTSDDPTPQKITAEP